MQAFIFTIMQRLFLVLTAIVTVIIFWTSFSQDTVDDLPGDFREEAFYRNENNTGPILRKYAVSLSDTLWQAMAQYGEMMPYTKYGTTTVYFFLQGDPVPKQLSPSSDDLDSRYQRSCIARYQKNSSGVTSFIRHPFK